MKTIKLSNSEYSICVDDEDFERLSKFKWYLCTRRVGRSLQVENRMINISIANEVMQEYKLTYDHIDRSYFNNQKSNLRPATASQNAMNREKAFGCRSKYKGVNRISGKLKYRARIKLKGVRTYLGQFDSEIEAAKAYDKAAKAMFGEFACLNFPTI